MSRKFRIFIAGSKDLTNERKSIKSLASELSSHPYFEERDIQVIAHSYEHFRDDQNAYNDFIKNKADLVLFIVDGFLGNYTKMEFSSAMDNNKRNGHPEVIVFVRKLKQDKISPEFRSDLGFLAGGLGHNKFYVEYMKFEGADNPLIELENKALERIRKCVDVLAAKPFRDEINNGKAGHKTAGTNKSVDVDTEEIVENVGTISKIAETGDDYNEKMVSLRKKFMTWIALAALAVCVLAGLLLYKSCQPQEVVYEYKDGKDTIYAKPKILFVGGGSVYNLFKKRSDIDIDLKEYDRSLFINMASGLARSVLVEEMMRRREYNNLDMDSDVATVCLSASKIEIEPAHEPTITEQNARLVEYYLGEDHLQVYVNKELADRWGYGNGSNIDAAFLSDKIKQNKEGWEKNDTSEARPLFRLFTTTETSGTLKMYNKYLFKNDSVIFSNYVTDNINCVFYYGTDVYYLKHRKTTGGSDTDARDFVILGSEYYYPEAFDDENIKDKAVYKLNLTVGGDKVSKSMYLYFMCYGWDNGKVKIRMPIVEFLQRINADKDIDEPTWNSIVKEGLILSTDNKIIMLNPKR